VNLALHWIKFQPTINITNKSNSRTNAYPFFFLTTSHFPIQHNLSDPFASVALSIPNTHQTFASKIIAFRKYPLHLLHLFHLNSFKFTPPHNFTCFPNWVLIKIWFFCLCFSESHEFQELGGFLGLLCQPAFEAIHEEVALCGHALQYLLLAVFIFLQLVVLVLCALFWVWLCLVQSLLCGRECSSNFWAPLVVSLLWF